MKLSTSTSPFLPSGGRSEPQKTAINSGSVEQSQRHDQAQIRCRIGPSLWLERRGALRRLEGQANLFRGDVLEDLKEIVRVEPNVERVAGISDGQLVVRF